MDECIKLLQKIDLLILFDATKRLVRSIVRTVVHFIVNHPVVDVVLAHMVVKLVARGKGARAQLTRVLVLPGEVDVLHVLPKVTLVPARLVAEDALVVPLSRLVLRHRDVGVQS